MGVRGLRVHRVHGAVRFWGSMGFRGATGVGGPWGLGLQSGGPWGLGVQGWGGSVGFGVRGAAGVGWQGLGGGLSMSFDLPPPPGALQPATARLQPPNKPRFRNTILLTKKNPAKTPHTEPQGATRTPNLARYRWEGVGFKVGEGARPPPRSPPRAQLGPRRSTIPLPLMPSKKKKLLWGGSRWDRAWAG